MTKNILRREKFCTKAHLELEECPPEMMRKEEQPCEGHWGPWSALSECSATCGPGIQTKNRKCDNPPPMEVSEQCLLSDLT